MWKPTPYMWTNKLFLKPYVGYCQVFFRVRGRIDFLEKLNPSLVSLLIGRCYNPAKTIDAADRGTPHEHE